MQDPKKEITSIISTLCTTRCAKELEDTVTKYFVEDAQSVHSLYKANSRNEILGVFQLYRLSSPDTKVVVGPVLYDSDSNILVVEVKEKANMWYNPFPSRPGDMIIQMKLRKTNGVYCIAVEETYAHLMDCVGLFASPLLPLVAIFLWLGCLVSNLSACVLMATGLNSGLRGGTVNYAGLLEAAGLTRKINGGARDQRK